MWAANQRRVEIVKMFLGASADATIKNQGGLTAADIAKLSGNRATLACFIA
jgi:ankyrin repeat protein